MCGCRNRVEKVNTLCSSIPSSDQKPISGDIRIRLPASLCSGRQNFVKIFAKSAGTLLKNNYLECNLATALAPACCLSQEPNTDSQCGFQVGWKWIVK